MMPFADEFTDVYTTVKSSIATVSKAMGVLRLDDIQAAGSITNDLIAEIRRSALCLADVTGANPNVMWEVDYAAALGKPVVVISQEKGKLPFDIRDIRTLVYDRSSLTKTLGDPLVDVIKATLERYVARRRGLNAEQQKSHLKTLAITGSTAAPPGAVTDRLERLLDPYINSGYHWYVGSVGDTDEAALNYLIKVGEPSITVVGYNSYDISEQQLRTLEKNQHVSFMDAQREQIAVPPGAPSKRDVLFVSRADLLIVVWNGKSQRTKALADWLSATEKDHILGFISPS